MKTFNEAESQTDVPSWDYLFLTGARLRIEKGGHSAIYLLHRLEDAGQQSPRTVSYRADCQKGDPNFPTLVIRVPCLDNLSRAAQAERVELVKTQFRRERDILDRLRRVPFVPARVECSVKRVNGAKTNLPDDLRIVREFVHGTSLDRWMADYAEQKGWRTFTGLETIHEWFTLAGYFIKVLESIHHERIYHGDLRPENIIIEAEGKGGPPPSSGWEKRVWLINAEEEGVAGDTLATIPKKGVFRRKYDSPSRLFEKRTSEAQAEQRNARADWYAPADIFSLGVILLELACGRDQDLQPFLHEEPQPGKMTIWNQVGGYEKRRTDRELKDYVLEALKLRNAKFPFTTTREGAPPIEIVLRIAEVVMACIRTQTETQSSDLRNVAVIVDQFAPPDGLPQPLLAESGWRKELNATLAASELPPALRAIMLRRADLLDRDLATLTGNGLLRVSGSRAHLVDVVITLLRSLSPGDRCRALTTPTFFFEGNMGPYGRVASALQLAALAGVLVDWIIVVDEQGLRDSKVCEVLEAQKDIMRDKSPDVSYEIRFAVVTAEEYAEILRQKTTFIEVGPKTERAEDKVFVAPDYRGEAGTISVIRLWSSSEANLASAGQRRKKIEKFTALKRRSRGMEMFSR